MNPYTNQFMPNGFEDQNQQGLSPVFQNIGAQQQYLNQQLNQGNQMSQSQGHGASMSSLNPLAMAAMLRNKKPEMMGSGETPNYSNPYINTGGYFDQGAYGNSYGIGTGGFE
jgi:hypothetical protein